MFYYVYVLESLQDGERYVGSTTDLKTRVAEHNAGNNFQPSHGVRSNSFTTKRVYLNKMPADENGVLSLPLDEGF